MDRMTMNFIKRAVIALMVLTMATACAETPQEGKIKKQIEQNMGDNIKVDSVKKSPYAGLYEVQANGSIFYTDAKAQFVFIGNIFDAKNRKNLTKERVDEINKIAFSDLPLDMAMKRVKGDGKRVIAVFSDPNCGHCKRLEANLKEVDNVTIYTFMFNILSPDSATKGRNVWCADNRNQVWEDWMLTGKTPSAPEKACEDPGGKVYELGKKLHIDGTPTIFFSDGSRIAGAIEAKTFEEKFATLK